MSEIDKKYCPNAFVIGAPKCGTTWLYDNLAGHPDILIPRKEIHYFSNNYSNGPEWFLNHFREKYEGQKILMDLATNYIYDRDYFDINFHYNKNVAGDIKNFVKDPKLIFIFRDPVKRAFSEYINLLQGVLNYGLMYKGELRTLSAEEAKKMGFHHHTYYKNFQNQVNAFFVPDTFEKNLVACPNLIARGFYDNYLKNYFNYFDKESMLFLEFEMIRNNPEELLRKIYRFLDIPDYFNSDKMYKKSNAAGVRPLPKSWRLQSKLNLALRNKKSDGISKKILEKISERNNSGEKPKMKPETAKILARWFTPHNLELEKITGLDLSHWTK